MRGAWYELFVDMPAVWDLGLRVTLLLALAWLIHLSLLRGNPRWRVQLWRFASLGVLMLAVAAFLPKFVIAVTRTPQVSTMVFTTGGGLSPSKAGAGVASGGFPEINTMSIDGVWRSSFVSYQPPEAMVEAPQQGNAVLQLLVSIWQNGNVRLMLGLCWCVGTCLLAFRWVVARVRIHLMLSRCVQAPVRCRRLLQSVADGLDVSFPVELRLSREAGVPFVAGWWRPTIVLPVQMIEADYREELPAILAHELTHVRSRDLFWMGVAQWVAIPLWFHPLTWRIRTAHAMACEEVADVVAAENVGNVESYSGTLARVALAAFTHPPAVAVISMARAPEIMSRLARLKRRHVNSPLARRSVVLAVAIGALTLLPLIGFKFALADQKENSGLEIKGAGAIGNSGDDLSETPGARVLEFPADREVGTLEIATDYLAEDWEQYATRFDYHRTWDWKKSGSAQGKVSIPAGAKVKLNLNAVGAKEMSWVKKLKPDDLYAINIYPHPATPNAYPFGDAHMRHLAHFTGLVDLMMHYVQVTDRGVRHLESMRGLEILNVYAPECGNGFLKSVGTLPSLKVLNLGFMKWTDAGLLHLSRLKTLEEIAIPHRDKPGKGFDAVVRLPNLKLITGFTFRGEHLAHLKGAKALRGLCLDSNEFIRDEDLVHLANLPQLEYLDLFHANVTDAGVEHLRPLKSLRRLCLNVNQIPKKPVLTVASANVLSELKSLEWLELSSVGGADEFLEKISVLSNLKVLYIGGRPDTGLVSDSGLVHLAKLKNLTRLMLYGTEMSDKGAESLSQLSELTSLATKSDFLTDAGIPNFMALRKLENLELSCSRKYGKFTLSGVNRLNGHPTLTGLRYLPGQPTPDAETLDLSALPQLEAFSTSYVRDKDLAGLSQCKKLRSLEFGYDLDVGDEGMAYLADLTSLETLAVRGREITDAGLDYLKNHNRLYFLTLQGKFTDLGLQKLERIKSLESLNINSSGTFSPSAVQHLQASLPNLYMFSVDQNRANPDVPKAELEIGKPAPAFTMKSLDGNEISLETCKGKVTLMYFWATSCGPCVASMPQTKKTYEALSKYPDFEMISLSCDDNEPLLKTFLLKHKPTWPQVRIGKKSQIAADFGVSGFPSYVLIGRDGKILCTEASMLDGILRKELDPESVD
ncbi:MAG: redoxin family protein [Planctomycetaceae bacterium]|nr:redoxin family protein [Planctomycetaceae bacterium]